MTKFVSRATMDAVSPALYSVLPTQFRDRLPEGVEASPQNSEIIPEWRHPAELVPPAVARIKYFLKTHTPN